MSEAPRGADPVKDQPIFDSGEGEPAPLPEKPRRPFWKRALRWLLGLLIVFSLGALLALYLLYMPARQAVEAGQADLEASNQKIGELEKQVESLSALESKNQELEAAMQESDLHVNILKARADIATALLALAKDDPTRARVALSKTAKTLETIKGLLDASQGKAADDMQARLKLALGEIGQNDFAAESDLNVLATGLMELENSYFAAP